MSNFKIVSSASEIVVQNGWLDVPNFKRKNQLVDEFGKKASASAFDPQYQLIAKHQRAYSLLYRIVRIALGILASCVTAGLALYFSKTVQQLFTKSKESKLFGVAVGNDNISVSNLRNGVTRQENSRIVDSLPDHDESFLGVEAVSAVRKKALVRYPSNPYAFFVREYPAPVNQPRISTSEFERNSKESSAKLAPLPSILSCSFDSKHELMQHLFKFDPNTVEGKMQQADFMEWGNVTIRAILNSKEVKEIHKSFSNELQKTDFNMTALKEHAKAIKQYNVRDVTELSNPRQEGFLKCTEARIKLLNETVQFCERIKRLEKYPSLQVIDIAYPWGGRVKFDLLLDEELANLTIGDLGNLDSYSISRVFDARKVNLRENGCTKSFGSLSITDVSATSSAEKEDVKSVRIIDICKLSAAYINAHAKEFPSWAFSYISDSELSGLSTKNLSQEQVKELFWEEGRCQLFSGAQINDCIEKIQSNSLGFLTENQIVCIETAKITSEIFNGLFSQFHVNRCGILRQMSNSSIASLMKYFVAGHWRALSLDQIKELDFGQLSKTAVQNLFNPYDFTGDSRKLLQQIPIAKINQITQHFVQAHWEALSLPQIQQLDFARLTQEDVKHLFDPYEYNGVRRKLLQQIPMNKINQITQHFVQAHWEVLTLTQIQQLDFAQLTKETVRYLFDPYEYNGVRRKQLQQIPMAKINLITQHFVQAHWEVLSLTQIQQLDFARLTQEDVKHLFDPYEPNGLRRKLLQQIPIDKINLITQHFSASHWQVLTLEQIQQLDFAMLQQSNFEDLFPIVGSNRAQLLQKISLEKIYQVAKWFRESHWNALSAKQIKEMDFTRLQPEMFSEIFALFSPHRKLFGELNHTQLLSLKKFIQSNYSLLDQLTSAQRKFLESS